jgi:hypothetical protein
VGVSAARQHMLAKLQWRVCLTSGLVQEPRQYLHTHTHTRLVDLGERRENFIITNRVG